VSAPVLLRVADVSHRYEMGGQTVRALDGVSVEFAEGEFAALAGPSGSGKTTLLNLIGVLDRPTAGRIELVGRDVARLDDAAAAGVRRHWIGFIFQAYNLIPVLTARENVEFPLVLRGEPPERRRGAAAAALAEVGLAGLEDRRPTELSGGQQQRVAVARAIVARPKLVLADEPTANLDSATAGQLLDVMEALNRRHGVTFLFSSHDPGVLARARRVVRLKDGRVEADERA
jgi:putative ABC transport system ATP-binding protein